MARLKFFAAFILCLALPAAPASASVDRWSAYIAEASARFGIPEAWIRRVMTAESGGRTSLNGRPIESRAGAMGLMQLMPGTWRTMRAALGLGQDPHDPRDNILPGPSIFAPCTTGSAIPVFSPPTMPAQAHTPPIFGYRPAAGPRCRASGCGRRARRRDWRGG